MAWNTLGETFKRLLGGMMGDDPADPGISRRELLTGLGFAGAVMVAGPALLSSSEAAADVVKAQHRRRDDDHHRGRDHDRGRGHGRGHGRGRYSRSDLRRRCHDRRFRHRNRRLCSYAGRRGGRRGSCVSVGPFSICD